MGSTTGGLYQLFFLWALIKQKKKVLGRNIVLACSQGSQIDFQVAVF
jgi:hypothetical protein